jgi:hypothetical protein
MDGPSDDDTTTGTSCHHLTSSKSCSDKARSRGISDQTPSSNVNWHESHGVEQATATDLDTIVHKGTAVMNQDG